MRPIVGTGSGNASGANANNANPRPLIIDRREYRGVRIAQAPILQSGVGVIGPGGASGVVPAHGTFKDSSGCPSWANTGRPIGAMRYKMPYMGPVAIAFSKPRLRGVEQQIVNPDLRFKLPGWTTILPVNLQTRIAQAMRRPYMHTPS